MRDGWKQGAIILFCVFLLALALVILGCKSLPPSVQIQNAMDNLWICSPEDNKRFHQIPVPITWSVGDLQGLTLAATTVRSDSVHIVFDWNEIQLKRERLEPVIAHEIDHAYEAYNVYGFDQFVSLVNQERDKQWGQRTVEKSAIELENQTRRFLIKTYPSQFKGMLPYRQI
jgi:hypothetical protein